MSETRSIQLSPSALTALGHAADRAVGDSDGVGAAEILVESLRVPGAGARVLEIMAPGRGADVLEALEDRIQSSGSGAETFGALELPDGRRVALSASGRHLFERLLTHAGRTLGTGDLVRVEVARPTSDFVAVLAQVGVGGHPDALAPQLEALVARVGEAEDLRGGGAVLFEAGPTAPPEEGPTPRIAAGDGGPPAPSDDPRADDTPAGRVSGRAGDRHADGLPGSSFTDLLEAARDSGSRAAFVDPETLNRVLAAVDRNALTVVATDSPEGAQALVDGLAGQLARDSTYVLGVRSLIAVEPGLLATDPDRAVREGLRISRGGLLVLPGIARLLDGIPNTDRLLRGALARREARVLGLLAERDLPRWTGGEAPEHELIFMEPTDIEGTKRLLAARRATIEAELSYGDAKVVLTDEAIGAAARLADRYYRDPPPPAGAIRLLREAGTALKLRAAELSDLQDPRVGDAASVDADDVAYALERLTGIETHGDDTERLLGMEDWLRRRVVGQDEAISAVSDAVRRARAGLKDLSRPIGSFLFLGPSGVGKTELAKALTEFLFEDEREMVRLDMSEYQERHTVSRLVGAPPGYVGYDAGGQLTEPVRRKPYQLVLFDEIEKAHPDIHHVLLQIMEDGRLTDSHGRTVDFRHTLVIMTGNVGSEYFRVEAELGREKIESAVREEAREVFRPEFLGRIDEFLIFNSLGPEEMRLIVGIQERKMAKKLADRGLSISFSPALRDLLADAGYAPELGARPLRNEIRMRVERPLSRALLEERFGAGDRIVAALDGDKVAFRRAEPEDDIR